MRIISFGSGVQFAILEGVPASLSTAYSQQWNGYFAQELDAMIAIFIVDGGLQDGVDVFDVAVESGNAS